MTPETLFQVANAVALIGWLLLAFAPLLPKIAERTAGYAIPIGLAFFYALTLGIYMPEADGSFTSLAGVAAGFAVPGVVLVGWLHYLALDLFVGGWEVRTARREGIAHWKVLPCLVLTLLAAPVGLALFLALRAYSRRATRSEATA